MASSDDFRKQLKAGNITEAFALALSKAVELKITTWVASAADDGEIAEGKPGTRLRTYINTIDGNVENEIGDQFIGNGPYKELQQFHLDQVSQSNKIIQKNLQSLQKLFEILVTHSHQSATTSVIEPNAFGVESQILPSTEEVIDTEAELANGASFFEAAPLTAQQEATAHLANAIAPTESEADSSAVRPDTSSQELSLPSEEPVALPTTPTDNIKELDLETDEDDDNWDDSVLDLLESLPVRSPSASQDLDSEFDEDRRNLIADTPESDSIASDLQANQDWGIIRREDFESPPAPPEPHIESLNSPIDKDRGDLTQEEPEPSPAVPESLVDREGETLTHKNILSASASSPSHIEGSSSEVREDWGWGDLVAQEPEPHSTAPTSPIDRDGGTLTQEDVLLPSASPAPHIEVSNSQIDEDWGDMLEEEPEPDSDKLIPNLDSLDLEEDEEWDEWVVEEPESVRDQPVAELDSLDLGEDEDWGDLDEDSDFFAAAPTLQGSVSDLAIDEDWDELAVEELQPYVTFLDEDTNIDAGLDTKAVKSGHYPTENPDVSENLKPDSSTEKGSPAQFGSVSQTPAMTDPLPDVAHSYRDVVLGETGQQKTQPDSTLPNDNSMDSSEDALLSQIDSEDFSADAPNVTVAEPGAPAANAALIPEESHRGVLSKNSDPQVVSEDDIDTQQKPGERRVPPPPPPPRRFPHQNK